MLTYTALKETVVFTYIFSIVPTNKIPVIPKGGNGPPNRQKLGN